MWPKSTVSPKPAVWYRSRAYALSTGLSVDFGLATMGHPHSLVGRGAVLVGGIVSNGLASGLYVGAHLGPGPRAGLWVAITRKYHSSIRLVRTVIELTVLTIGWLMGGVVGWGTVLYALSIGHLNQYFLARVQVVKPTVDEPFAVRDRGLR